MEKHAFAVWKTNHSQSPEQAWHNRELPECQLQNRGRHPPGSYKERATNQRGRKTEATKKGNKTYNRSQSLLRGRETQKQVVLVRQGLKEGRRSQNSSVARANVWFGLFWEARFWARHHK
jgi:hypothetical protein